MSIHLAFYVGICTPITKIGVFIGAKGMDIVKSVKMSAMTTIFLTMFVAQYKAAAQDVLTMDNPNKTEEKEQLFRTQIENIDLAQNLVTPYPLEHEQQPDPIQEMKNRSYEQIAKKRGLKHEQYIFGREFHKSSEQGPNAYDKLINTRTKNGFTVQINGNYILLTKGTSIICIYITKNTSTSVEYWKIVSGTKRQ